MLGCTFLLCEYIRYYQDTCATQSATKTLMESFHVSVRIYAWSVAVKTPVLDGRTPQFAQHEKRASNCQNSKQLRHIRSRRYILTIPSTPDPVPFKGLSQQSADLWSFPARLTKKKRFTYSMSLESATNNPNQPPGMAKPRRSSTRHICNVGGANLTIYGYLDSHQKRAHATIPSFSQLLGVWVCVRERIRIGSHGKTWRLSEPPAAETFFPGKPEHCGPLRMALTGSDRRSHKSVRGARLSEPPAAETFFPESPSICGPLRQLRMALTGSDRRVPQKRGEACVQVVMSRT
ncbi:hypothetical protein DFJ77DRAFT_441979 [Powellomyces hirtus]|nr:hypothetical protein DFJ77DRAFT_441979 [Powellomyces hirtus]